MTIENDIEKYRRRLRLSQAELASRVGYERASLSDIEQGGRMPSLIGAFKLAIALCVPVEFAFKPLYIQLRDEMHAAEGEAPKRVEHTERIEHIQQPLF
jgi:DNA-binding XRE family transcriptional regulator